MLKLPKAKKTKKKFYDKWCYKINLSMEGCVIFRLVDIDDIENQLNTKSAYRSIEKAKRNRENILTLAELLANNDRNSWQLRIEGERIDVYTNDEKLYNDVILNFTYSIIARFEPDQTMLSDDKNKIITNTLPHGRFRFKVYLKPHRLARDVEAKNSYLSWIDTQSPRISISESVKSWFISTDWNWDRRYIWVEDESTLLMLKLRNADVCGKVYEYQLCDK
jgi:hypothetical protein